MNKIRLLTLTAAILAYSAAPARADGFISPFLGYNFGGDSQNCVALRSCEEHRKNWGVSLGSTGKPFGFPQLIDHIKLGFAYQMHLKDEWQKVRLAHVSSGRSFFVFTRGGKHQETISMTSRMLARMCETGRFRAVESSYLMERATVRARKQLAELRTPTRH